MRSVQGCWQKSPSRRASSRTICEAVDRHARHLSKEALEYRIHTNRELGMMLRREKPLAIFSDVEDAFPTVLFRYLRLFDRHVKSGQLVKREKREAVEI